MQVTRICAIAIFNAFGFRTADKWPNERMAEKLTTIFEHVDNETRSDDPAIQAVLEQVVATGKSGGTITVVDGQAAPAPAPAPVAPPAPAPMAPPAPAPMPAPLPAPMPPTAPPAAPVAPPAAPAPVFVEPFQIGVPVVVAENPPQNSWNGTVAAVDRVAGTVDIVAAINGVTYRAEIAKVHLDAPAPVAPPVVAPAPAPMPAPAPAPMPAPAPAPMPAPAPAPMAPPAPAPVAAPVASPAPAPAEGAKRGRGRPKGSKNNKEAEPKAPSVKAQPAALGADGQPLNPEAVRYERTRPYLAGLILRKFGMEIGVTADMVAALNFAYGDKNDTESKFALRNAWHAVRAYCEPVATMEELDAKLAPVS